MKNKNIYNLIYFLNHSKAINRIQQRKRDALMARDFQKLNAVDEGEENPIDENSKEPLDDEASTTSLEISDNEKPVKYTSPLHLYKFLYRFNQDEILKYTCHDIDTEETRDHICDLCGTQKYSLSKHSQLISQKLNMLLGDFKRERTFLDNKFIGMVMGYIDGKKSWSAININISWQSPELIEWGNNNPGIIPNPGRNIAKKQRSNGFGSFPACISHLNGKPIYTFRDVVVFFKSLFHIRRDNSLRDILEYQNKSLVDDYLHIYFSDDSFHKNIELLTDVDKLVQAYKKIINICKNAHNTEDVININLSFYEEGHDVLFGIHDTTSVYGKSLNSTLTRIGKEQHDLIKRSINGLCDLYVEADFDNGDYARVGIWTKDCAPLGKPQNLKNEKLEKFVGVRYILKFEKE